MPLDRQHSQRQKWTVAASGRATPTRKFIELVNLVRIRFIRLTWWDTRIRGHQAAVGSRSARGLASTVTDSRGYPGSDTGSTCGGEVVTASGGGNTESSASGHRSWDWKSCYGCFSQDNSNRGSHRGSPLDSDPSDGTGTEWCVSHVGSRVMLRLGAQT